MNIVVNLSRWGEILKIPRGVRRINSFQMQLQVKGITRHAQTPECNRSQAQVYGNMYESLNIFLIHFMRVWCVLCFLNADETMLGEKDCSISRALALLNTLKRLVIYKEPK